MKERISLKVNGRVYELRVGDLPGEVAPSHTLAHTLRETLQLTGTKVACDHGACGACTVIVDGRPVLSCMTLTVECDGREITTIEGLENPKTGELHPIQQAFVDHTAFQCGFCTPGIIMSAKALLDRNPSPKEGEIEEALSGHFCRCITHYHVLRAVQAASGKGSENAGKRESLESAKKDKFRFIGKSTPRKDAAEIVTGKAKFIDDVRLPHMLHGKVLRSPYPHALIVSIDTKAAKSLPGVRAVLTHEDVPELKAGTPPHLKVLDSKVRFAGDAVALVAAETEEIASEALDLISVEYEPLTAVYEAEEAVKPGAPRLYDEFPDNVLPSTFPWFGPNALQEIVTGDIDEGLKQADVIAEGTFSYENLSNPLPLETPAAIAMWEGPDVVHVWLSTQSHYMDRIILHYLLGRKVDVRTHSGPCGGSYGSKGYMYPLALQAILLAKATGRPVKIRYTKEEHLAAFTVRLGSTFRGRVGMKRDGTVTAVAGEWLVNTGHYSAVTQGQVAVALGEAQLIVRCDNWSVKPKVVCTNRLPSGWIRGFGGQELKSVLIPLLTAAMEKAGVDPVEFFKKNFVKPGDSYYWRDGNRWTYRGVDYSLAIEKGAEAFGWKEKWKGWLVPTAVNGPIRTGVGVGVHGNADIGEDVSEAYVRLNPDHTATLYTSLGEQGTGQRSNLCKMVAEVLRISPERILLAPPDPVLNPYESGPVGSRGTYAIGSAAVRAALDARQKLLELAALKLGIRVEDLDTEDGVISVRGETGRSITWRQVMDVTRTILGYGRFEPDYSLTNFMVTFVEVSVDTNTGKVELLNVVNATDVGQIIDPLCLENQLCGCLGSAGIDSATFEESILDKKTGRILNPNLIDYKWRTFSELPQIHNVVLETPFPTPTFGAIGVGEITTAPGPPAVLMAVSNAIGVRLHSYPVTPERVLEALGKAGVKK